MVEKSNEKRGTFPKSAVIWMMVITIIAVLFRIGLLLGSIRFTSIQDLTTVGDAIGYNQLAVNLIKEGVYRFDSGQATAFRMPGYPFLLAAFYFLGTVSRIVLIGQILLDALSVCLVFIAAMLVYSKTRVAVFAALIIALHPWLLISSLSLIPDTLATTLCAAMLVLALFMFGLEDRSSRWIYYLSLGSIAFLAVLVVFFKPSLIFFSLSLMILMLLTSPSGRTLRSAFVIGFVFVIMFMPWIWRNFSVFDAFIPLTTSGGSNFYAGNNAEALGGYASNYPYVLPDMDELESDVEFRRKAQAWINDNPRDFLKLLPRKFMRHFSPLALGTASTPNIPQVVLIAAWSAYLFFYFLNLTGCVYLFKLKRYHQLILLCLLLITVLLPSLIAFGASRFVLPSLPAMAILGAFGLEYWIARFERRTEANIWE